MNKISLKYIELIETGGKNLISKFILFILWILSLIYSMIIRLICLINAKRKKNYPIKIISIGNLTWGGTGKTTLTLTIAEFLINKGLKPCLIYHGRGVKDEIEIYKTKLSSLKIYQAKNRKRIIEKVIKNENFDCVILDDGFQQWGIYKDLEILCLSASSPFGNGYLIPRGQLREPKQAMKRADLIFINKCFNSNLKKKAISEIKTYNPQIPVITTTYDIKDIYDPYYNKTYPDLEVIRDKKIFFFSGIGDPLSALSLLELRGIKVIASQFYPDHYNFGYKDLLFLKEKAIKNSSQVLLTTEKDFLRTKSLIINCYKDFNFPIYIMRIKLIFIENEEILFNRLYSLLDIR